jgi:hypothetical protein
MQPTKWHRSLLYLGKGSKPGPNSLNTLKNKKIIIIIEK